MLRRPARSPLSLAVCAAFATLSSPAVQAGPCPSAVGGQITVTAQQTTTCTLGANQSIQVQTGAAIAPADNTPYGIFAPAVTPVGAINVAASGVVQVSLGNSPTQSATAISINGPSMDSFSNAGTVIALGWNTNGFSTVAVDIQNTAIAHDFYNNSYLTTYGYDPAVRLANTVIGGNFLNDANGKIQHQAASTPNTTVLDLDHVNIVGDFINNGLIADFSALQSSVVRFTSGTVGGILSNAGTMSDLSLDGTQVGAIRNSGTARRIGIANASSVGSVTNTATGNLQSVGLEQSTAIHGIRNEGVISSSDPSMVGIYVEGGTIADGGIFNTASGQITNRSGILLRSSAQVTGGITNAGTITSAGNAIGVGVSSTVNGDIVNSGTISASGGQGINISNSAVNGRIVNSGEITASTGIRVGGSTIAGGIDNSGTINAPTAITLSSLGAPLTVTNTGTLNGAVELGTATLNVNGGTIAGPVTGAGATVNINTDFTPRDRIQVSMVNVTAGHALTLANTEVAGPVTVASGATLAGSGSVGTTTLASGATLSPGTSTAPAGALTVNGDLTFASGSTYRVDAGATGATDTVHATGAANLAGSVLQVGTNGQYAASTNYTIIEADGGLRGKFDDVSSNLAYLSPTLAYAGNTVTMNVELKQVPVDPPVTPPPADNTGGDNGQSSGGGTRPIRFADLAVTGNQRSVANAIQTLPAGTPLNTRVLNLPNGAPPAVFASLSGESHASTVSTLQTVTTNVVSLPMAHLRASMNAGQLPGPATAQVGRGDASALPRSAAQPMWAQVFGNWRTLDGNGNAAKTRQTDGGLFVGGDHGVGAGWRLGGALGYTGSHISTQDTAAKADVDSYSAVVYGGRAFKAGVGKINLTLGSAYTWHDIKSQRDVDAAGQGQSLKSSYGASTTQFFTELGYALPLSESITLEPFVAADYSDLRTRGFSESGGDAALNGEGDRNRVGTTTLGLHAQTAFDINRSAARLHGTVGWRHAYGDVNPKTTLAFDGSQSFTVAGAPIAKNAALFELGVDMAMNRYATIGMIYSGQFGGGNQQNSGTLAMNWRF